jgi:mono/diheme cytochrome c family protein
MKRNSGLSMAIAASSFLILSGLASCGKKESGAGKAPDSSPNLQQGELTPLVTKYCVGCHTGASPKAGVRLDNVADAKATAPQSMEEIESGDMPTAKARLQPTAEERQALHDYFKSL